MDLAIQRFGLRLVLLSILWWNVLGMAQAASLSPQFVELLNGNTPIRYFKVGFSGSLFIVNGKPLQGWVYYEGSIQKDTFWIRNCTNSIPGSGQISPGNFIGMSYKEYWSYKDAVVYISGRESKTASPLDDRAESTLSMVRQALGLGTVIERGSMKLKEDNSFEAKVKPGEIIRGQFEVSATGYPTRCEYSGESFPGAKAIVVYDYSGAKGDTSLPTRFVHSVFNLSKEVDKSEYQILACEFGDATLPQTGYTVDSMTNWGEVNLRVRDVVGTVLFRDGAVYNMSRSGELKLINRDQAAKQNRTSGARAFTLIALFVTTVLLLLLLARAKSKSMDKRAQITKH